MTGAILSSVDEPAVGVVSLGPGTNNAGVEELTGTAAVVDVGGSVVDVVDDVDELLDAFVVVDFAAVVEDRGVTDDGVELELELELDVGSAVVAVVGAAVVVVVGPRTAADATAAGNTVARTTVVAATSAGARDRIRLDITLGCASAGNRRISRGRRPPVRGRNDQRSGQAPQAGTSAVERRDQCWWTGHE